MQSVTYEGKVEGMIVEIEILAWTILGLDAPKDLIKKRRKYSAGGDVADSGGGVSWTVLGGVGLAAAAAIFSYTTGCCIIFTRTTNITRVSKYYD